MTRRSQTGINRDPRGATVMATTISFAAPGTIADSGNGLGAFAVGDRIEVRGSALNSRIWTVTAVSAGALTVAPGLIRTAAAGASITITRI